MTRKKRTALELGHDAFLDIVANLVGILIILVVVLGAQSTSQIEELKEQLNDQTVLDSTNGLATDEQLASLAQQSMRAAAAQADSDRFESKIKQYEAQIDQRKRQRDTLLDLLAEAESAWEQKKAELDKRQTESAERQSQFETAKAEFAKLQGQRQRLEDQPEPVVAVEHLPTPMAKTVFGDELHFRLKGNLLSLVPVDKLVDEIRRDFERVAPGSRNGQISAAVGPIRGYVARYRMDKSRGMVSRGGQVQLATRIQLVGMTVEPLNEPHGQSLGEVFNNGTLDIELAGRNPDATTITVWVYPDSFAEFRRLKEHLYERGFATAARPLPMDHAISGGPQGSRSNAQ